MTGILFDLDGVFYVGDQAVPGAAAALQQIAAQNIPYVFLTNTTSRPRSALVQKLQRLGIETRADYILTPPVAAARWIHKHVNGSVALFVPEATRAEFVDLLLADQHPDHPLGAIVLGDLGEAWDFATLNHAFRLLMQKPAPKLIALGMTRYWQAPDGLRLDVAPFVVALQHASGVEPLVLGKPAQTFFDIALEMIGCNAEEAMMIGDDIQGDIAGAQAAGIKGLLVRTGKFRESDLQGSITPYAVLDTVAELPRWWQQNFT